mmetsp:Transcript_22284/g.26797  ORF Transcript_22284/g.26797 Transcript_22284/m.26797 type:complete len:225 (+) Transcript_22284:1763-2437(+)
MRLSSLRPSRSPLKSSLLVTISRSVRRKAGKHGCSPIIPRRFRSLQQMQPRSPRKDPRTPTMQMRPRLRKKFPRRRKKLLKMTTCSIWMRRKAKTCSRWRKTMTTSQMRKKMRTISRMQICQRSSSLLPTAAASARTPSTDRTQEAVTVESRMISPMPSTTDSTCMSKSSQTSLTSRPSLVAHHVCNSFTLQATRAVVSTGPAQIQLGLEPPHLQVMTLVGCLV